MKNIKILLTIILALSFCIITSCQKQVQQKKGNPKKGIKREVSFYCPLDEKTGELASEPNLKSTFLYNTEGNPIDSYSLIYSNDGTRDSISQKFDNRGNEIRWARYSINSKGISHLYQLRNSKYNSKGKLKKSEEVIHDKDGHEMTSKTVHKYDKRGKRIREISEFYSPLNKKLQKTITSWKYNSEGKLIEKTRTDDSRKSFEKTEYYYDDKGNIKEIFMYGTKVYINGDEALSHHLLVYDEKNPTQKELLQYDDKGNLVKNKYVNLYEGSSFKDAEFTYTYDSLGNKLSMTEYRDGRYHSKFVYKRKYDQKGNLIENATYKVEFKNNKEKLIPTELFKIEIEYW